MQARVVAAGAVMEVAVAATASAAVATVLAVVVTASAAWAAATASAVTVSAVIAQAVTEAVMLPAAMAVGDEGHGGSHSTGSHGGSRHAGGHGGHSHDAAAGALRAPLYWLSWPFGYYVTTDLTTACGEDSNDIAGLPIDQYRQAIVAPTDAQRAALDDLANAAANAAQNIKAACPADLALTAPGRLAAMQQRIEAMIAAVQTEQPPLGEFYGLLNDEQKARVNAIGVNQRPSETAAASAKQSELAQNCNATQLGGLQLPSAEIDKTVRPTDEQRMILVGLQNATTQAAADLIKASCVSSNPFTPAARLAAVGKRLEAMLQSVKSVRTALNDFYGKLSDEQKAKFEAIGPQLTGDDASDEAADEPEESPPRLSSQDVQPRRALSCTRHPALHAFLE